MPANDVLVMEGVRLIFRNFTGREGQFNQEGARNFGVVLPEDLAEVMLTQLSYQQTIEYRATGGFRVVGARTGNLYRVTPSNGFELIDAYTNRVVVSYCLHTEHWLPSCDQALAIKMALEDRELEVEVLEGAKPYPRSDRRQVRVSDQVALRLEREHNLFPEHRELDVIERR